jgi:hypothetical protein
MPNVSDANPGMIDNIITDAMNIGKKDLIFIYHSSRDG